MYWNPQSNIFTNGVTVLPISAGTLLKADSLVDLERGLSVANRGSGDLAIGESIGNGNYQTIGYSGEVLFTIGVKLWFPTYSALLTGGSLATRGYPLFGVTGGYLSVVDPGNATPMAVAAQTLPIIPDQLIHVYKVYIS